LGDVRPKPGPHGCPNGAGCDGSGWVHVLPSYAEHRYPQPRLTDLGDLSDAEAERVAAHYAGRRHAALNTVYPCKGCRPTQFFAWCAGHHAPDHGGAAGNRAECPICKPPDGEAPTTARRRRGRHTVLSYDRKDWDD
jgi:hypothetical protein